MEGSNLTVVDLNTKDFLRQMGNCIQYGLPCLLQVCARGPRDIMVLNLGIGCRSPPSVSGGSLLFPISITLSYDGRLCLYHKVGACLPLGSRGSIELAFFDNLMLLPTVGRMMRGMLQTPVAYPQPFNDQPIRTPLRSNTGVTKGLGKEAYIC